MQELKRLTDGWYVLLGQGVLVCPRCNGRPGRERKEPVPATRLYVYVRTCPRCTYETRAAYGSEALDDARRRLRDAREAWNRRRTPSRQAHVAALQREVDRLELELGCDDA